MQGADMQRLQSTYSLATRMMMKKLKLLIKEIDRLKESVGIPASIEEFGVSKNALYDSLDVMSERAFDDQCTGANPRYPLISEIKQMYINAFEGK